MSKPTITREALEKSRRRQEQTIGAEWRYREFFKFLQLSPSYRLAHLIATGQLDRLATPLPVDFELVEETYRAFGEVIRTDFWEWWVLKAQFQFRVSKAPQPKVLLKLWMDEHANESDLSSAHSALNDYISVDRLAGGTPATLVVALSLDANSEQTLKDITELVSQTIVEVKETKRVASWAIIRNKIRWDTALMARTVLRTRAAHPDEYLFVIGNMAEVSPINETDPSEKRAHVLDKRRTMEIMTSRHLHRAYTLAENAARGRFPTLDPLPDDPARPKFDFKILLQDLEEHVAWLRREQS